jgi:hypothetical protein
MGERKRDKRRRLPVEFNKCRVHIRRNNSRMTLASHAFGVGEGLGCEI